MATLTWSINQLNRQYIPLLNKVLSHNDWHATNACASITQQRKTIDLLTCTASCDQPSKLVLLIAVQGSLQPSNSIAVVTLHHMQSSHMEMIHGISVVQHQRICILEKCLAEYWLRVWRLQCYITTLKHAAILTISVAASLLLLLLHCHLNTTGILW